MPGPVLVDKDQRDASVGKVDRDRGADDPAADHHYGAATCSLHVLLPSRIGQPDGGA
jgi:hypothetical protein